MAARLAPAPADTSSTLAIDAIWLRTLQRICARSAHELKGALNAVSVNVEVVRSRAAKPDAPASAVAKFADAASTQFEAVMSMSDALLALARDGGSPAEIGATLSRLAALLGPAATADGKHIELEGGYELLGATSASSSAARAAIGESLLAAMDASAQVVCRAEPPLLRIEARDGAIEGPGEEIVNALREAGIEVRTERSVITISFPRHPGKAEIV